MLTSKDAYFVDLRISLESYQQEKDKSIISKDCLQWAFAGKSRTARAKKNDKGDTVFWHGIWDHWIDSRTDDPEGDEGDMTVQEDGTVLEEGANTNTITGTTERYEELWEDLRVDQIGQKGNKSSIVLRADDPVKNIRGLLVKVGGWCQGIVKDDGNLTVERWRRQLKADSEGDCSAMELDESTRTPNDWVRLFKIGSGIIPTDAVISETKGRLGLHAQLKTRDDTVWNVIEEYYY